MTKEINIEETKSTVIVDGISFKVLLSTPSMLNLKRDDGLEMAVRRIPLFYHPERMTNREISFLRLDTNKKCFRPGGRKNPIRVDN